MPYGRRRHHRGRIFFPLSTNIFKVNRENWKSRLEQHCKARRQTYYKQSTSQQADEGFARADCVLTLCIKCGNVPSIFCLLQNGKIIQICSAIVFILRLFSRVAAPPLFFFHTRVTLQTKEGTWKQNSTSNGNSLLKTATMVFFVHTSAVRAIIIPNKQMNYGAGSRWKRVFFFCSPKWIAIM